jgi:hypothetical protein
MNTASRAQVVSGIQPEPAVVAVPSAFTGGDPSVRRADAVLAAALALPDSSRRFRAALWGVTLLLASVQLASFATLLWGVFPPVVQLPPLLLLTVSGVCIGLQVWLLGDRVPRELLFRTRVLRAVRRLDLDDTGAATLVALAGPRLSPQGVAAVRTRQRLAGVLTPAERERVAETLSRRLADVSADDGRTLADVAVGYCAFSGPVSQLTPLLGVSAEWLYRLDRAARNLLLLSDGRGAFGERWQDQEEAGVLAARDRHCRLLLGLVALAPEAQTLFALLLERAIAGHAVEGAYIRRLPYVVAALDPEQAAAALALLPTWVDGPVELAEAARSL